MVWIADVYVSFYRIIFVIDAHAVQPLARENLFCLAPQSFWYKLVTFGLFLSCWHGTVLQTHLESFLTQTWNQPFPMVLSLCLVRNRTETIVWLLDMFIATGLPVVPRFFTPYPHPRKQLLAIPLRQLQFRTAGCSLNHICTIYCLLLFHTEHPGSQGPRG